MDWKEIINEIILEIIEEKKLYENAIFMTPNYGKCNKLLSYSICLWEKDYPEIEKNVCSFERNSIVANIKDPGLASRPDTLKLTTINSDVKQTDDMEFVGNATPYWLIRKNSEGFREYFKNLIEHEYNMYTGKSDAFGCCSRYKECSDAHKCIHVNQMYAKACMYRKNLENGKVFY